MPEEIFVLFLMSIMAFTVLMIVGMSLRYKSRKAARAAVSDSSSLTTSELERMMRRAVAKATEPLEQKIDHLEDLLAVSSDTSNQEVPQLESGRKDLLADMDLHETEAEDVVSSRRQVR